MPICASWLVNAVVALVEESAFFRQESLEAVGPYYSSGSSAEFWSAEVEVLEERQDCSKACMV